MKINKLNKTSIIILSIIVGIFFLSCLHFTFYMDEEFTMGLMKYNYLNIIHVDELDVHPPLYYLILKLFLQICTSWTSSMFIKVLFARIFSIIVFVLLFCGLISIIKELNIKTHSYVLLLFYSFIPSIAQYALTIRMYDLASMFIIFELYFLIKFNKYKKNSYLILIVLFASLASYTHYYAAVSAGLFILISCIYNFLKKRYSIGLKFLISGICFAVLYVPLLPVVFKQFKYETQNHLNLRNLLTAIYESTGDIPSVSGILRSLFSILLLILFILLIVWSYSCMNTKFNKYLTFVLLDYLATLMIAFTFGVIKHTPFTPRYTYMDFSIYTFFVIVIFTKYIYRHKRNCMFYVIMILSLLCVGESIKATLTNIKSYDIPSITLISNYNSWKLSSSKNINITRKVYPTQFGESIYIAQSAIYLQPLNKNAVAKTNNIAYMRKALLGHNNHKLYKDLVPNMKLRNKYNS